MADPVDPIVKLKQKWITQVVARVEFSDKNLEALDQRNEGQRLIQGLGAEKEEMQVALQSITFKVKKESGSGTKTMNLLDDDGDYRQEIDTRHHTKKMEESLSPEQRALVKEQLDKILKVEAGLKDNPYYNADKLELTPIPEINFEGMSEEEKVKKLAELVAIREERTEQQEAYNKLKAECDKHKAEDLWEPLVREGIIPENFVPQELSSVVALFDDASEIYEERLQEYSEGLTDNDLLLQKFELGAKIGQGVLKLASASAGLAGSVGEFMGDDGVAVSASDAESFIGHISTALTISEGVAKAALTDKDFTAVGQQLADAITKQIASGLSDEAAKIVTACVSNASRAVDISKKIREKDFEGAFTDLVDGIASELANFDPDGKDGAMTFIGANLQKGVAAALKGRDIGKMLAEGKSPAEIINALMDAADMVAGDVLESVSDDLLKSLDIAVKPEKADEDKTPEELEAEAQAEADAEEAAAESDATDEAAQEAHAEASAVVNGKFDRAEFEKRQEEASVEAARKAKLSMEEQIEADREEFDRQLRSGFPMATSEEDQIEQSEFDRVNSIEYLMAIQAKNAATFKFCEQIAKKGVALVVKVFPPAALAEACMTLILTIKDAVEKNQEMMIWRETVDDSKRSMSAQTDAMLNRSGLQTKQAMQANVQVALDATKIVAEALAFTPGAPAAPIVKASVAVAEAAIELADLIYTEVQLANAWKIYQKAKDDPQDRYLARKAMRENPTLAKYAMAYGAMNGDPIATEGMRRCGINKQTLSNPSSDVNKVVEYLEAKYPDDPVLLRAVPVKDKWHPGPVELKSQSWTKFYFMATTEASPLVDSSQDTSGIAAAIGKLEVAESKFTIALEAVFEAAKDVTIEQAKVTPVKISQVAEIELTLTLGHLADVLGKYKSLQAGKNLPHKEMAVYIDALSAQSEIRLGDVTKMIKQAPWTARYKKEPA